VDARRTPEAIFVGQAPNQIANLRIDAWSPRTPRTPPPMPIEPIAMPAVDGGRLNQPQRISPLRPNPAQEQPQQTVGCAKPPIRTREDGQLVVQGEHLEKHVATRRQYQLDRRDRPYDVTHPA
jgi:hypothetical protein